MTNGQTEIGRRAMLGGVAAAATATYLPRAWAADPLKQVPRNRTYIVASSNDGPKFTNSQNANYYSTAVDLRNGLMYAYEPLFLYNFFREEHIPWTAESYAYNDDFTAVTIKLRPGITWTDGHKFTARDVAFTYNMLVENGNTKKNLRKAVEVAQRVKQAVAVDDLTARIDLSHPDPRHVFVYVTSYFAYGLFWVPEHIWRDVEDKAGFTYFDLEKGWPLTTAAWKVVSASPSEVICDRRDDWWGAKTGFHPLPAPERIITVPYVSRERVAQLAVSNELDVSCDIQDVQLLLEIMRRNPKLTTFSGDQPPYGNLDWWPLALFFNATDPRWDDVRVRRAIGFAMNTKQIVDVTTGGASAVNHTPYPGFPPLQKFNDAVADLVAKYRVGVFDPAESEKLMLEAGYQRDAQKFWARDGKRVGGDVHGLGIVNQIGPLVQQQLRRAGFEVTFYSTPDSSRIMATAECPLMLSGHAGSSIFDPLATLEIYHSKNFSPVGTPTFYYPHTRNKEYDAAVDPIVPLKPGDPAIMGHFRKAMEIWYAMMPEIPIQQYYHRLPMNQTYWKNWSSTSNAYMPPASNHVTTSMYIPHMVRPSA